MSIKYLVDVQLEEITGGAEAVESVLIETGADFKLLTFQNLKPVAMLREHNPLVVPLTEGT